MIEYVQDDYPFRFTVFTFGSRVATRTIGTRVDLARTLCYS